MRTRSRGAKTHTCSAGGRAGKRIRVSGVEARRAGATAAGGPPERREPGAAQPVARRPVAATATRPHASRDGWFPSPFRWRRSLQAARSTVWIPARASASGSSRAHKAPWAPPSGRSSGTARRAWRRRARESRGDEPSFESLPIDRITGLSTSKSGAEPPSSQGIREMVMDMKQDSNARLLAWRA